MFRKILLVLNAFVLVTCDRQKRLFSFDYRDKDINVDVQFAIPFLSIPIKDATEPFTGGLPTINVNPASLALAGAVLLGTTVLLPLLLKHYGSEPGYERYSRMLESTDFSAESLLNFAQNMLVDNRGLRNCALRVACWTEQQHYYTKPSKFMMQIIDNKLVSSIVNSTAIEDAMLSGRYGRDCESYSPCPLQKEQILLLMDKIAVFTY